MEKTHKRKSMLIAFIMLHIFSVQSQNIDYGLIIGADITNMYLKPVFHTENKAMYSPILSYNFNGFISYKTNFFLGFSLEPGIIRKGGVQLFDYLNSQYEPVNQKVITSITSFQLPVLLDFHINKSIYLSAGVELEYRLTQKAILTNEATTNQFTGGSLYVVRGKGPNTIADNIIPDENYPFMYYSYIVSLQYILNNRFDLGLKYGASLKELYSILWVDINHEAMANSNLYTSYLQLSLKVKL
jgi:hypothetical protein